MPASNFSSSSSAPSSIFSIAPNSPPPMGGRCIEELHFDVPLISTRRSSTPRRSSQHDTAYSTDTSRSVPFLWERAPGVPKDHVVRTVDEDAVVYTPRPPPGRWRPPNPKESSHDVDDDGYASDTDVYSDALEKISLSESQGIPCRLSVSKDTGPCVNRAPSFIMNRFLPAANALAASSAGTTPATLPKHSTRRAHSGSSSTADLAKIRLRHLTMPEARRIQAGYNDGHRQIASPSKACGIMLLFPLGMKRAVCGLKSPIRCQTSKITAGGRIDEFAQRSKSDFSLSSDDGLSSRAWKSPGWGLPFLDTSRLRRSMGMRDEKGDHRRQSPRRREGGRTLPRLKTPSEPWLANALSSVNRRRH